MTATAATAVDDWNGASSYCMPNTIMGGFGVQVGNFLSDLKFCHLGLSIIYLPSLFLVSFFFLSQQVEEAVMV